MAITVQPVTMAERSVVQGPRLVVLPPQMPLVTASVLLDIMVMRLLVELVHSVVAIATLSRVIPIAEQVQIVCAMLAITLILAHAVRLAMDTLVQP